MRKIDERGFALVEAGAALPILFFAITGVCVVIYLCIAQAWLNDAAEEAALCVAERVSPAKCEKEFSLKTRAVLPFGGFTKLSVDKYGSLIVVHYVYQTAKVSLQNKIQLQLPVSKRAVGKL